MNQFYPYLFEPLRIRNTVFRNRIFCAPSNHCLQGTETYPTESAIRYYAEKARGGAATVIAGSCIPDPKRFDSRCSHIPKWNQYNIHDPFNWRYFRQQSDAVHCYGAKACFEFHMPPRNGYNKSDMSWTKIYGPSPMVMPDGLVVDEMPEEEMERIAEAYAAGAEAVVNCGFDMLLIHGGHGMLIEQFLSPRYNRRTDKYGGCLENRARFPQMIVDAVRDRVGNKLIIEYRISGTEITEGALDIEESKAYIKMIQDKIDIVHVSAGDHSNPHTRAIMHPSGFLPPAPNAYLAKAFKNDSEIHIPVAAVGAIYDPEVAEQLLRENWCDIVSTARGLIADPFYPEKARHGRKDDIVPCIKCFHCLDDHKKNHYFSCSVNPLIGRSGRDRYLETAPDSVKRVAVIGGGPAGMKAALQTVARGHKVTLYEQAGSLGGQLQFSRYVPFKYDLAKFMDYLIHQVEKAPITVRLNTKATPELILSAGYDAVIAATGASHTKPIFPVKGPFFYAAQVFGHTEQLGESVAVIGGGQVGCETALYLAGCGKHVTLVSRNARLAHDAIDTYRTPLLDRLEESCTCLTGKACIKIDSNRVYLCSQEGEETGLETDSIVIATGMHSHLDEALKFYDSAFDFEMAGDCLAPKNVKQAIRTAFDAANRI